MNIHKNRRAGTWPKARPDCLIGRRFRALACGRSRLPRYRLTWSYVRAGSSRPGSAASVGVSKSTVGRVLARAGPSRLEDLAPSEPVARYEHARLGDLGHIDINKLGRIERMRHRITGNRRDSVNGAGWEFLSIAIDDHARIGFTDLHPDERHSSAVQFLQNTIAYF